MLVQIANSNDIDIIYISVEEQINTKNLKNFIKTNLELNNIYSYKNKKIYLSYIFELKEYQISIFPLSLIPIFYIFTNIKMDTNTLFICNDFFILYKNLKPYYFKKTNNTISTKDIKTYIKSKLNLEVFQVRIVSKEEENTYIKNYQVNKYQYKFIYLDTNKSFVYYFLYVVLIFSCFFYFFENITNNKTKSNNSLQEQKQLSSKLEDIKKQKEFTYISKILLRIFEEEKKLNINIISISYNNNKIDMIVSSTKKDKLFDLLSVFTSTKINNINHEQNKYILNATIIQAK